MGHKIELPVLYFRDDLFILFFTADYHKVRQAMPSERLYPIRVGNNRAMLAIAAFNYIETTIGPYGEVAVAAPVTHGDKPAYKYLPGLLESRYPGFGLAVLHLPVTNHLARVGGREIWGYPKFVAHMEFSNTPDYLECNLFESDHRILHMRCPKRGLIMRDRNPLITYSVKDKGLIKTIIPQKGVCGIAPGSRGAWLRLGNHVVSESIRDLGISAKPFASRYYLDRAAILPEGRLIEKVSRPLDGHTNELRDAAHKVNYLGSG